MSDKPHVSGALAAVFAFLAWGLLPVYWKALAAAPAFEIICHRVVWSQVCTALLLLPRGGLAEVRAALRSRRDLLLLACSSSIIGVNWFLYIYAVNSGQVLEASLGYYLNPLVNVLFGVLFFRDRLRPVQILAVALAAAGVAVQVVSHGAPPWLALGMAVTFGVYGMVRKLMSLGSLPGLFVETGALTLPAGGYLAWLWLNGQGAFLHLGPELDLLMVGAGAATTAPLLAFAFAARRITLTTLGVLQYLGPTGMFLLGVLAYGEPFGPAHAATFGLIWAGVALYTAEGAWRLRQMRRATFPRS
ncbi:MAG: EamA family transporter RarD [Thermodesulfobacteriota bacterium]